MGDRKVSRETLFWVKLNPSLRCIFRNSRRIFKPSRGGESGNTAAAEARASKGGSPERHRNFLQKKLLFPPSLHFHSLSPLHPSSTSAEGISPSRRRGNDHGRTERKRQPNLRQAELLGHFCQAQIKPGSKMFLNSELEASEGTAVVWSTKG